MNNNDKLIFKNPPMLRDIFHKAGFGISFGLVMIPVLLSS